MAVKQFLGNATSQGIQKIIIDMQQNRGGDVILAFTTFRQFFPQAEPFAGSHKRSHNLADILGETFTNFWDGLSVSNNGETNIKSPLEGEEWIVTPRINTETGKNFTSWAQYAGPILYRGDSFSLRVNMLPPAAFKEQLLILFSRRDTICRTSFSTNQLSMDGSNRL
jgi:hypothetical protein